MSYDVSLRADLGGPEPVDLDILDVNYTWNVGPMIRLACNGETPNNWSGMLASDAALMIWAGIAKMEADPAPYIALNPKNGWGDYEGCLVFLKRIANACDKAPNARLYVC